MDFEDNESLEPPSKTQRKKEMHALQAIGARLTGFSDSQLDKLPLSAKLRKAIAEFNRLPNSHGARRRQLQYIGRLMRDFELDEIETAIDRILQPPRQAPVHQDDEPLKLFCNMVLKDGDDGINRLLEQHPDLDRQTLRRRYLEYQKAERDDNDTKLGTIRAKLGSYLKSQLD